MFFLYLMELTYNKKKNLIIFKVRIMKDTIILNQQDIPELSEISSKELRVINGGSGLSEAVIEYLGYIFWKKSEVSPQVAKNNYNGTYWNAGMRGVI